MSQQIFGLVVGIDQYPAGVRPLSGCTNDAASLVNFLRSHCTCQTETDSASETPVLKPLINEQATRDAIIRGFREHLINAGKGDIALFAFSGHGSQEAAPEEFWEIEPDRQNETLVCYDSRTTARDLSDKELGKLISEIAANGAHVVVILDCCHSGSGTRGIDGETAVRYVSADLRPRPAGSYLFSVDELAATRGGNQKSVGFYGKHVLLAACRSDQLAKETAGDGQRRGAFSYCLLDALKNSGGVLTYQELFARTDARVRATVTDQSPQLEVIGGASVSQVFLDGAIRAPEAAFVVTYRPTGWTVNAGAVHGIQRISADDSTAFALFAEGTVAEERIPENKLGEATVTEVQPAISVVKLRLTRQNETPTETIFQAVVIRSPVARLAIRIEGVATVTEIARQAMFTALSGRDPSLYIRESETDELPRFVLHADENGFAIRRPADGTDARGRLLVEPVEGSSSASAAVAIRRLEALARWTLISELNSHSSEIPDSAVAVEVMIGDEPVLPIVNANDRKDGIRLEYRFENGKWVQPQFRLKVTNTWKRDVYCALVVLSDNFQIWAGMFKAGGQKLKPGEVAWALDGQPIFSNVPKDLHRDFGITEYNDYLKIIVSTQEFDARLLEQPALDLPRTETRSFRSVGRDSSLNRLMQRISTRNMGAQSEEESIDDWRASQICFTTVRPLDEAPVPSSGEPATIAPGIKVNPHPALQAQIRISTMGQSTRGLLSATRIPHLPRLLTDDPDLIQPLLFSSTRGSDPGLSVLELLDVKNSTVVTPDSPLTVELGQRLFENEAIIPVVYERQSDGTTLFLPVGFSERRSDGTARLVVNALPTPESDTRSLTGAVRIFCSKIRSQLVGSEYQGSRLARVTQIAARIHRIDDWAVVRAHVEHAQRIVLFIHGIIGDTDGMAKCAFRKQSSTGRRIADDCDLILTFDYENLGTPIAETARDLKEKLEKVGLGPDHGKSMQIVAHSMGGLVSRWMIEREGGNRMVERLIMLGTPNGGSPWPNVHDWAMVAAGIGLNSLCSCIWPPVALAGLYRLARHDVTLNDMTPGSQFLADLAASPDPGIQYALLAGNTSLCAAALAARGEQNASLIGRLIGRLTDMKLLHKAANPLFFNQPNDIAVSVENMKATGANRSSPFQKQEVACDHLSYFVDQDSQLRLASLLGGH